MPEKKDGFIFGIFFCLQKLKKISKKAKENGKQPDILYK